MIFLRPAGYICTSEKAEDRVGLLLDSIYLETNKEYKDLRHHPGSILSKLAISNFQTKHCPPTKVPSVQRAYLALECGWGVFIQIAVD